MADKKISQLTGATTPLAGTEVLPIVQGGSTVKVSIANVTAGRAVAGSSFQAGGRVTVGSSYIADVPGPTGNNTGFLFGGNTLFPCDGAGSLTNGVASLGSGSYRFNNLHIAGNVTPAAGKGIDFSANGGDVLTQYDEGTYTPVFTASSSNPTVTYGLQRGKYVRVGNVVTVSAFISWSAISGGSGDLRISLPFAGESSVGASGAGPISSLDGFTFAAGRTFCSFQPQANVLYGNLPQTGSGVSSSNTTIAQMASSGLIIFSCTYLI